MLGPDELFDFDEVGFGFGGRVVLVERGGIGLDAGFGADFGAGLDAGFGELDRTSGLFDWRAA